MLGGCVTANHFLLSNIAIITPNTVISHNTNRTLFFSGIMSALAKHAIPGRISAGRPAKRIKAYHCLNPRCGRSFATQGAMKIHLAKTALCNSTFQQLRRKGIDPTRIDANDDNDSDDNIWDAADSSDDDESQSTSTNESSSDDGESSSDDDESSSEDEMDDPENSEGEDSDRERTRQLLLSKTVRHHGIAFTTGQLHETRLLKILEDANARHDLFYKVMTWANHAFNDDYCFEPRRWHRKSQINHLEKAFKLTPMRAQQITIRLSDTMSPGKELPVPVTRFPFVPMFRSLIADLRLFGDFKNLNVDPTDPFGKYQSPGNYITENALSGSWYDKSYDRCITDPVKQLFVPIIMESDAAVLRKGSKANHWPILFSTTLLALSARNLDTAWRPLGYVPDMLAFEGKAAQAAQSGETKAQRLHALFEPILEELIKLQNSDQLRGIPVTLGDRTEIRDIVFEVFTIVGDMQMLRWQRSILLIN